MLAPARAILPRQRVPQRVHKHGSRRLLASRPERLEPRVVEHGGRVDARADLDACEAEVGAEAAELGDGGWDVLEGDGAEADEAGGVGKADGGDVVVEGAGEEGCGSGWGVVAEEDGNGGEDLDVDARGVHFGEAGGGGVAIWLDAAEEGGADVHFDVAVVVGTGAEGGPGVRCCVRGGGWCEGGEVGKGGGHDVGVHVDAEEGRSGGGEGGWPGGEGGGS